MKRLLIIMPALALVGCDTPLPPLEAQEARAAGASFVKMTDNHGCIWRLEMQEGGLMHSYAQIRDDGKPDCPERAPKEPDHG